MKVEFNLYIHNNISYQTGFEPGGVAQSNIFC